MIPKNIPNSPGIYKMLDKEGRILYIGKAKNLKNRVRQYFQKSAKHSIRTQKLLEKVENIKYTATDTELEALILETTLIKQVMPKYNILMKDDKNYVYIKITDEDFPKIQIVRKIQKDNSKYIGPKTAANKVTETLKVIKKIFPFRHCSLCLTQQKNTVKITNKTIKYPCLDYYIKRCAAPCIGKCTKEEYQKIIKGVIDFLKGKADNVIKSLKTEMIALAQNKQFEKAAKIRDKIEKVTHILEKQKVSDPNQSDKDVINYLIAQDKAYFNLFQIRDGKLIGQENFILQAKDLEDNTQDKEVLEAFLIQYYSLATDIPKEILLPHDITNKTDIRELSNKKISFIIPKIGVKIKLLELSLKNAKIYADRNKPKWYEQSDSTKEAAKTLQTLLKIKTPLKRIECYDISHLSGTDTVGSMIVFKNGAPDSSNYRKFKIKTFDNKPDDCKAIEEVLTRRFSHLQKNSQDYKFRKAIKKDINLLQKEVAPSIKRNHLTYKNFFVLENKKKTTIAFAALRYYKDNKAAQINALWVEPKERGKKLGHIVIKEIIKKSKAKRIYLGSKNSLTDYYLEIGFEIIKHPPKEMLENLTIKWPKEGHTPFVYDTLKHKVDKSFSETPDLVIIDGGKGQLSTASKILAPLKIPHISIAKKFEEIYTPTKKTQISLPQTSDALKLIQRARDEAHRFAINYNQTLRSKKIPKKR